METKDANPSEMRANGYHQCEDIIKVFVTSQPTSLDILELPKLGKPIERGTGSRTGREDSHSREDWAVLHFIIHTTEGTQ
jgi:hypothetical protein